MFSIFSLELKRVLIDAKLEMKNLKHSYIGTEHVVLSILNKNNCIKKILNKFGITYNSFKSTIIDLIGYGDEEDDIFVFTPLLKKVMENAILNSQDDKTEVSLSSFFIALLDIGEGVANRIFSLFEINIHEVYEMISDYPKPDFNSVSELSQLGVNFNALAVSNSFDPVLGRDKEITNLIEILLKKTKNNPILVGSAGVGKTAIVEELSRRIVNEEVPYKLIGKTIISLSMANLISGTKYRGEFEEKLLKIIKEVENNSNIILFIDEIHTLVGAGGSDGAIDASNILKPFLSRGKVRIIGATTIEEYRKYIEDDKALSRRFQTIIVDEPDKDTLFEILKKVKISYEEYHNVSISDEVLMHIIKVSNKYIYNKKEPDRSIDILDNVCSMVTSKFDDKELRIIKLKKELKELNNLKINYLKSNDYDNAIECREKERKLESFINSSMFYSKKKKEIIKSDVNLIVSNKSHIHISDKNNINDYIKKIKNEMILSMDGYDLIVDDFLNEIKDIFIDCNIMEKPKSFLLIGKQNLEKNKFIEVIKNNLINNIIKINLNEYMDNQSISKLIGAVPGYVGYNSKNSAFESLKENNSSLIVFYNFNYASSDVKRIINQILDTGVLVDSNGFTFNFNNCILFFIFDEMKTKRVGFNSIISNANNPLFNKVCRVLDFEKVLNKNH